MLVDGHCSLCKGSTYFLAQRDVSDKLRFASQQSSVGKAILDDYDHKNLAGDTVVVVKDQSLYTESRAVIEILKTLGLFWTVAANLLYIIPWFIRDWVYRFVARHRFSWFGGENQDFCAVPKDGLRDKILD